MKRLTTFACLVVALSFAVFAFAGERNISAGNYSWYSWNTDGAKASGDTIDLMGPGGTYPYRGDFENFTARPSGSGALPQVDDANLWSSYDVTAPPNHWHVDTMYSPVGGSGNSAWCGDIGIWACDEVDPAGGYGNSWFDILEFRKVVTNPAIATDVQVQALMHHNSEPGYDYTFLVRRTVDNPNFEPITAPGQGDAWDDAGDETIDFTFFYVPGEYLNDEICVAFVFDSDSAWSDGDCLYVGDGGATLDNLVVTCTGGLVGTWSEDFEDGTIGPDWVAAENDGCGDFGRIWSLMGDADDCSSDYSKVVAFVDDGLVVPGSGPVVGGPGYDYGPPGGYVVNYLGGLLGPDFHIENEVHSPMMNWPDNTKYGATLAYDVYSHELLVPNDTPGIFYTWGVRSAPATGLVTSATFRDHNFVYYGGPFWRRDVQPCGDLITPNATKVQIELGCIELGWSFGYGDGTNGAPSPYFDNVRFKVYPSSGPFMYAEPIYLAQDNFPASGALPLSTDLANHYVRFDMARNISARSHLRNDPGDSIWCDVVVRNGAALTAAPVMYWTMANQNPLFDPYRVAAANPVTGVRARLIGFATVANRWRFDLPDTGFLYPGDVLHYYFAATDNLAGDLKTSYMPANRTGYGNPSPDIYPTDFTVNALPTITGFVGSTPVQPNVLFWNDFHARGGDDEFYTALRSLGLTFGTDYDVYNTHGPSSGVGNGLGGRATVDQITYYTDMLYNAGDLSAPTLSNGDFTGDPGNDLGLMNSWLALGGRDLFMTGDDLGNSLFNSGTTAQTFLETKMGVQFLDNDIRDNISGQTAPKVVITGSNPVFSTVSQWVAYGGCAAINDFDAVTPRGSAVRLAQFTASNGTTPWTYAAAILNLDGTNRIISMNHGLNYVWDVHKAAAPLAARTKLLSDVLNYFGVSNNPLNTVDVPSSKAFAVSSYPNPFNPSLTIKYTLKNPGNVVMKVYNVRGELVKTLLNGQVAQETGSVVWDGTSDQGSNVSSGVYFVETRSGGEVNVQKATMVK